MDGSGQFVLSYIVRKNIYSQHQIIKRIKMNFISLLILFESKGGGVNFTSKGKQPLTYTIIHFICLMTLRFKACVLFLLLISLSHKYRMFNLKVDRQLSREYFTADAIYNGSAGMTFYYYMCRSWQDCCRRGENRSWPSVSDESVDSECWCLNNAIFTLL